MPRPKNALMQKSGMHRSNKEAHVGLKLLLIREKKGMGPYTLYFCNFANHIHCSVSVPVKPSNAKATSIPYVLSPNLFQFVNGDLAQELVIQQVRIPGHGFYLGPRVKVTGPLSWEIPYLKDGTNEEATLHLAVRYGKGNAPDIQVDDM